MKQLTELEYRALLSQGILGAQNAHDLQDCAEALVVRASELGLVLTIDQVPTRPLRQGGYDTVVHVRPARKPA